MGRPKVIHHPSSFVDGLDGWRFELTLGDVLLHQVIEEDLIAAADGVEAGDGPIGAEGLVGRFVQQVAVLPAAVGLESTGKGDDRRHL